MNTLYIADHNPITFLQLVQDSIQKGLYADDSVASYPLFAGLNEITLTVQDEPKRRNDLSEIETVVIQGYDNVPFLLDVQDAILQDFAIVPDSVSLQPPYTVTLVKAAPATLDITPVAVDTRATENAPEEPTAAPKPTAKRKQSKSKEA